MTDAVSHSIGKKKIALTVGIDKYEDSEITPLSGAENDAKELFELLSSKSGGFVNDKNKCLLGERADHKNILKQISEIFRYDENFDIALFYFSGHGFVDKKDDLYLSTYDIDKKDPYINGLKVDDLTDQIYSSKNKRNAIMILDCCYSGTATNIAGAKGEIAKIKHLRPIFDKNFQNIHDENKDYGAGKFTISSSANDKESWEKPKCKHSKEDPPHYHGAFTYYLLEGLRGGAADSTTGEITLSRLQEWLQDKLPKENKQQPYSASSLATNTNNIRIALSLETYRKYISAIENEIESYFPEEDKTFPYILFIIEGTKKLEELKNKDEANPKIPIFQARLSFKLEEYKSGVITWCNNLPREIKILLDKQTGKFNILDHFSRTVGDLQLDTISVIGEKMSPILELIGNEVYTNATYLDSNDDVKVRASLMRFASLSKRFIKDSVSMNSTSDSQWFIRK